MVDRTVRSDSGRSALGGGAGCGQADEVRASQQRTTAQVTRAAVLAILSLVLVACGSNGSRTGATTSLGSNTTRRATATTRRTPATTANRATTTELPITIAPSTIPPATSAPPTAPATIPGGAAIEVASGPTSKRVVALTFDAGSDVGFAGEVLDILAAEHVPASFGITGTWAKANPTLVRRMNDAGQILNHTENHRSFTGYSTNSAPLSSADRIGELDQAEAAIRATGASAAKPWFRPPYGDRDASVLADVGAAGYHYMVMWSLDSLGWKGLNADQIVARCLDNAAAQPGAIYLFHVGSQSADHAALRRIIAGLRDRGFTFATVEGLLAG